MPNNCDICEADTLRVRSRYGPRVVLVRIIKKRFFENQKLCGSAVGLDKKNFLLFLETQKLYGSADGL